MSHLTRMTSVDRRAAILDAAVKLFSERGFRGTTTRALAEAVGVTEPVLYEHFKSKRDLYAAMVDQKSQEGMSQATVLLAPFVEAKNDRELFVGLGEFILRDTAENTEFRRLLISVALEDPELGVMFHKRQRGGLDCLAGYIAGRIADGVFRPVDPHLAAHAFIGMIVHHSMAMMLWKDDSLTGSPREIAEQMVDLFFKGISK